MKILKESQKLFRESPKLNISIVITLILELWTLISENAELFGIAGDTLTKISVIVSMVSIIWKQLKPEESAFKMVYRQSHVGTRPTTPPNEPQDPDDD